MIARVVAVVAVVGLGAGCPSPSTVDCGDGRVCPAGTLCIPDVEGCFDPGAAVECSGLPDGRVCVWNGATGACLDGICIAPECGNGLTEAGETCDDGDTLSGDLCSATCQAERCGNAILDPGEDCDCGDESVADSVVQALCNGLRNDVETGLCNTSCDLQCGDGLVAFPEACDGEPPVGLDCADVGFDDGPLLCTGYCALDTSACRVIGLRPESSQLEFDIEGIWGIGDHVVAVDGSGSAAWRIAGQWQDPVELVFDRLADVHGAALDDVFAVGGGGVAYRWDGEVWQQTFTDSDENLAGVWMPAPGVAYAAGSDGTVLHWTDATGWLPVAFPSTSEVLTSVYAVDDQVFVTSLQGTLWHKDGDAPFTSVADVEGSLYAVWGRAAADVYASGASGIVGHWDGTSWTLEDVPFADGYNDIWGDADELFVVGGEGAVLHHDAQGWKRLERSTTAQLAAVGGADATDLVIGGTLGALYAYRGQAWAETSTGTDVELGGLWHTPGVGVVIGGDDGVVIREDHGVFTPLPIAQVQSGPFVRTIEAQALYAPSVDSIFATGRNSPIGWWDGTSWTSVDDSVERRGDLWGPGDDTVWAAGIDIKYWDGSEWQQSPAKGTDFTDIWGLPNGQLAAVGSGIVQRYSVEEGWWFPEMSSDEFLGVWLDANGRIWEVGAGALLRAEDTDLHEFPQVAPVNFTAVHGDAPADVFVVGDGGTMARFDGEQWFRVRTPTFVDLTDVWVTPTMVYATGAEGTLLRLVRSTPSTAP